jgi:hypothetical protein
MECRWFQLFFIDFSYFTFQPGSSLNNSCILNIKNKSLVTELRCLFTHALSHIHELLRCLVTHDLFLIIGKQKQLYCNTVELVKSDTQVLWHPTKIYGPKVFLLTKLKPEYSDILYNPTHTPDPFVCRIRHVRLNNHYFEIMYKTDLPQHFTSNHFCIFFSNKKIKRGKLVVRNRYRRTTSTRCLNPYHLQLDLTACY